jgi:hypothetical protein
VRVEADLPTGVNSKGVDTQFTGILTRSFGRLRVHLNAGYTILGSPQGQERPGAYRAVAAVSYPLGYPTSFRDTLIASVYTRQSDLRGQRNNTGVEVGIRHQLTSRMVVDAARHRVRRTGGSAALWERWDCQSGSSRMVKQSASVIGRLS